MALLLGRRARVNAKNSEGRTPLHAAAVGAHLWPLLLLLERGANLHAKDSGLNTALHLACSASAAASAAAGSAASALPCVRVLLENGADPSAANTAGDTPLHLACGAAAAGGPQGCDPAVAELLISRGASLSAANKARIPSALSSYTHDSFATISTSLSASSCDSWFRAPPPSTLSQAGDTPAHVAASRGRIRCLGALLSRGAPLEAQNAAGETPLHLACACGPVAGAADDAATAAATAAAAAAEEEVPEEMRRAVAALLLGRGARTDARDKARACFHSKLRLTAWCQPT